MAESKNRDLAIAATSKIFEKVTNSFNAIDSDKRWFWELLQNAKDTVVYKSSENNSFNNPNKKVDVKLFFTINEKNEKILRFEHNGNPFKSSNHPYKFDDPKCLLLADSGKIEEDESLREDITGQFGTGFLSTHILSLRVLVEGIFFDKSNTFSKFNFELDRRALQNQDSDTKLKLAESVEKSLDQYDNNFKPICDPTEFKTTFTYYLSDNKIDIEKGIEIVQNGLDGLDSFIPYVLAFSKEIRSIEIFDDIISHNHVVFSRAEDLKKNDKEETVVRIDKKIFAIKNSFQEQASDETIYISTISDIANQIDLGNRLYKNEKGFEFREIDTKQPILFCIFPLIGSENWRFPLIFNCSKFYPKTERDGITLLKDKDNGNWERARKAIDIYKKYCSSSIANGYSQLLFLADTRVDNCPNWCDENIYRSLLDEIREFLLPQPIVINEFGNSIILQEALFPISRGEDSFKKYWDICFQYCPTKIPQYKDIVTWNKFICVNYKPWEDLKFPLKRLLSEVQEFKNLQVFADAKFDSSIVKTIDWLNNVYQLIIDRKKTDYFKEYKIIPTNSGMFKSFSDNDLFIENDAKIPDKFIEILKTISDKDWNDILIHRDLIEIDKTRTAKTIKDISDEINKILNLEEVNNCNISQNTFINKEGCESILLEILSIFPTSKEDTFQSILFDYAKLFFNVEIPCLVFQNIGGFDFAPTKRQIIKLLNTKISNEKSLDHLKVENPECWLRKYLLLLQNNSEFKNLLEFENIFPNRLGVFKGFKDIRAYGKDKPLNDDLIKILKELNEKEDWNTYLIHDGFRSINLKESKTIEELASKILLALEDLRFENLYSSKSNAILELIEWCSNPENEDLLTYFRAFIAEKDKIFVNISLEDDIAGDNIVKLLNHKEKLSDLVEIAEMSEIIDIDIIKRIAKQKKEEKEEFEYKIKLGEAIEIACIDAFKSKNLPYDIIYQGIGNKDIVIRNSVNQKEFYIELKSLSPTNPDKKLKLAISQAKEAVKQINEDNYVLSILIRPAKIEAVTVDYITKNLKSQFNIGRLLKKVVENNYAFEQLNDTTDDIYIEFEDTTRKVIIPERIWNKAVYSFDCLIEKIKDYLD